LATSSRACSGKAYQVSLGDHGGGQWIAVFYAGHGGQQPLEDVVHGAGDDAMASDAPRETRLEAGGVENWLYDDHIKAMPDRRSVSDMEFKKAAAGTCLRLVMIGVGGDVIRIASPLCDWHRTACEEATESPVHMDVRSLTSATGS